VRLRVPFSVSVALALTLAIGASASANPTDPFLWPYNQTTNITFDTAAIAQAWQEWKSAQITSMNAGGAGRLRVMGGINESSTVSEGQGYGILFASPSTTRRRWTASGCSRPTT
jgi:hypothetical protein